MKKVSTTNPEPEDARIVHLRCPKCDYPVAIEEYNEEENKYVSMCLAGGCHYLQYHDEPHEQRSSNGNKTE